MSSIKLLDRPIAFQRVFVRLTGSITGALMMSQAVYWQNRCDAEDGWWWKTQEQWEMETGMTRRELESARRSCGKLLEHERRGVPCKSYYRVNSSALDASLAESAKLDCTKAPNLLGVKRHTANKTETTTETTPSAFPKELASEAFKAAWKRWEIFRKEKRQKLTSLTVEEQIKFLATLGEVRAIESITQSIRNGWQGLFEPKNFRINGHVQSGQADHFTEAGLPERFEDVAEYQRKKGIIP